MAHVVTNSVYVSETVGIGKTANVTRLVMIMFQFLISAKRSLETVTAWMAAIGPFKRMSVILTLAPCR